MAQVQPRSCPCLPARAPFQAQLSTGQAVRIEPIEAGSAMPAAWVARAPHGASDQDLGIAWWMSLPWRRRTAIGEVVLGPGQSAQGLGRVLLDLLVLSATECGIEWLQVRLPERTLDLDATVRRLNGRPVAGDPGRIEIPLAHGHRRYHPSGFHRARRPRDGTTD